MPSLQALIGRNVSELCSGRRTQTVARADFARRPHFVNAYLTLLVWPMIALGWVTNIFQRGAASMGPP